MSIPGIDDLMRQAQELSRNLTQAKEELAQRKVEASAGGGMVRVRADGRGRIVDVQIEPQVADGSDIDMLQDLIIAAANQALEKSREMAAEAYRSLTGGIPLPGMDDLFR